MSRKDISDLQVLQAIQDSQASPGTRVMTVTLLMERTGQCEKVVYRAMERALDRGYLDYGVSLRGAWVTKEGEAFLAANDSVQQIKT